MKLNELLNYDVIIFDCDGVLLDVNTLKCEAFAKSVENYPRENVEGFVEYCKNTFGISRYQKFKDFFNLFAKEDFQEEKYNYFLDVYADSCKKIYNSSNLTEGALELLEILKREGKKTYIASGSDELELREVFSNKNLNNYFNDIYGSPNTKSEAVKHILASSYNQNILFIGDALADSTVAKEHNLDYMYMYMYTLQSSEYDLKCRESAISCIKTFKDVI
ncbi:HAD hydrolase-like protein [Priestia megaterium]|uniref:HAD family hydrolase n=1 Tax=Priestia megaterium TaxID=1404 RepID=UPI002040C8B1|nr:HAD family hydrolase [Priestia megaterium]MCM3150859.1 HAD hydrolase-like protein [Priestia megaterium]